MAACLRLNAVLQTVSHGFGCHYLRMTSVRQLSFLATQQGKDKALMDHSQLTHLAGVPHKRHKVVYTKKRRKFVANHEKDGVSSNMALVYENNMNRYNFWGQLVINTLAVPIYAMSFRIIAFSLPVEGMSVTSGSLTAMVYIVVYGAFMAGVNGHCKRSISRMYADEKALKYSAVVQDWKMMKQTVNFDLSAVEKKSHHNLLGFFFGNMKIKGRSYLVSPTDFVQPKFYNMLMGYDLQRSVEALRDWDVKELMRTSVKSFQKPSSDSK